LNIAEKNTKEKVPLYNQGCSGKETAPSHGVTEVNLRVKESMKDYLLPYSEQKI
jgi:hypothetical protein